MEPFRPEATDEPAAGPQAADDEKVEPVGVDVDAAVLTGPDAAPGAADPDPEVADPEAGEPEAEPEADPEVAEPEADPEVAEPAPEPATETEPEASEPAEAELPATEPEEAEPTEAEPTTTAAPDPEPAAAPITAETTEPETPELEPVSTAPVEPTTVAELVAATLRAAGVRVAFTVAGESFLAILDALAAVGIRIVATRHEGGAAFAAEAYGQLTGRPAVCLGTRAVGAANLAIGIHTATADSTPMFVILGDVDRGLVGREAFQEVDLVGTVGGLATWAGSIDDPATAAAMLESAVRATVEGRPGPVVLAIPEDVQEQQLPEGTLVPVVRPHPEAPTVTDVRAVLNFLASAERPLILAGAGVLRARCSNDLVRFAELLHVPVIASWRRGDVIPNDHPLFLGMAGFGSPRVVRERIEQADALLVLGSRLNQPTTFDYRVPAMGQRWMHVDVEPRTAPVGFAAAPELAVRADARAFLRAANARLKEAVLLAAPLAVRDAHNTADRTAWEAATAVDEGTWTGPGVHPGKIIADLRRLLPDDAILTTDAGAFGGWAARGFRFRRPGTFLGPTSGAMGYGFPAALAAALVHRERRVVAVLGDGGMGMTLAEVETAVREEAHVVAIVFDNERYGMIRAHQDRQGSPELTRDGPGPAGLRRRGACLWCPRGEGGERCRVRGGASNGACRLRTHRDPARAGPAMGERR